MTSSEAASFGRKKALSATGLIIGIYLLIDMYKETRGDFANGFLFFLADIFNWPSLAVMALLFSMTYFLGGKAGKAIIVNNRNFLLIAIAFPLLITAIVISFPLIAGLAMGALKPDNYVERIVLPAVAIFASLLIIWLWAAYRMQAARSFPLV